MQRGHGQEYALECSSLLWRDCGERCSSIAGICIRRSNYMEGLIESRR